MTEEVQKLNDDGLIAGQEVDFSTLMRIKRKGVKNAKPKASESKPDEPKPKAKRKPKSSATD